MPKVRRVEIRLSEEEYNDLKKKAESVGGMSALLRKFAGSVRIRDRKSERERITMLNRINANLNMIAKYCNIHQSAVNAVEIISHLIAIERKIEILIKKMDKAE